MSENYCYVIQDEVQSYQWTQNRCSLHPVVIYTCAEPGNDLIISSLCAVSDDLEHYVVFVNKKQKVIAQFLNKKFFQVDSVHYFSNGCDEQYKNGKNFIHLCYHQKDFNLKAV